MRLRLIVALHGVGSRASDITPFADALGGAADIEALALDGPDPFDMGPTGRQWFSVRDVTEADRPARVARALPSFLARLDALRSARGLDPAELALAGFSQGAIMALAAAAGGHPFGAIIAAAGRLAAPVAPATAAAPAILLLHDRLDPVMPIALERQALAAFRAGGYNIRAIETDGYGHAIGPDTLQSATGFLRSEQEKILS